MRGISDPRSGLLFHVTRIIGEVRPESILLENVPGISFQALGAFIGKLAQMGYNTRSGVVGACCAGMDHMRERLWMVANTMQERRAKVVRVHENGSGTNKRRSSANVDTPANRISRLEERLGKPGVLGANDGLANRVDRLAAAGDGQIPSVVRLAWNTLSQS